MFANAQEKMARTWDTLLAEARGLIAPSRPSNFKDPGDPGQLTAHIISLSRLSGPPLTSPCKRDTSFYTQNLRNVKRTMANDWINKKTWAKIGDQPLSLVNKLMKRLGKGAL